MTSSNLIVIAKATGASVVTGTAIGLAAYEVSPETFSLVAVGVGSLGVAVVAVISLIVTNRNSRRNREQMQQIAKDQATALLAQQATDHSMRNLEIRMDGRMENLLEKTSQIAEAIGIKKGLQQAADTAADKATETAKRDETVVNKMAGAVVERIGEAAEQAAQMIPGESKKEN